MKNLQNLKGAKALNKQEQPAINGGAPGAVECCNPANDCCSILAGVNYSGVGCMYQYGDPNPFPPYYTDCI